MSIGELFLIQIRKAGLPTPESDHRIHANRQETLCYAWPDQMVAVIVAGGIGEMRETTAEHISSIASNSGWHVIISKPRHLRDGSTAERVGRELAQRGVA